MMASSAAMTREVQDDLDRTRAELDWSKQRHSEATAKLNDTRTENATLYQRVSQLTQEVAKLHHEAAQHATELLYAKINTSSSRLARANEALLKVKELQKEIVAGQKREAGAQLENRLLEATLQNLQQKLEDLQNEQIVRAFFGLTEILACSRALIDSGH